MKNGTLVVFKKEMARFLGDKRLFFTTVILPGLMIFIMYSIMGQSMSSLVKDSVEKQYNTYIVNMPAVVSRLLEESNFDVTEIAENEIDGTKDKLKSKDADLLVVFPADFEKNIASFGQEGREIPYVEVYYYSSNMVSSAAYSRITALFDEMAQGISNVFDVNPDTENTMYDVATDEDTTGTLFASILPMVLLMLIYSSCMAIAPESIAGEKERGTFAAMLLTPVPRGQIALGKVLALSAMALLGGISSCVGTILSMPSLMGDVMESGDGMSISLSAYTPGDYAGLIVIILSTVILFITIISVLSAYAKTVKEASTLVLPVMLLVMFAGLSSIYSSEAKTEIYWYLVPILNSVQSLIGIFARSTGTVNIAVTAGVNIVVSAIGMLILRQMFNSEKIMFAR